jgi:hypothetical protein
MKRQNRYPVWLSLGLRLGLFVLLSSSAAFAGDFRIVPGQRIGMVRLGMSRTAIHTLLHTPNTVRHLPHNIVLDTWLSHQLLTTSPSGDRGLKRDYLTVFFRHGQAVQIEVSTSKFKTAGGLSTRQTGNDFSKSYPNYKTPFKQHDGNPFVWGNSDPAGSLPAAKHVLAYGDAEQSSIAWKCGAWGDLAPDPDPNGPLEAVIVHLPNQPVLLNPNDGLPYSGTGPARK